MAKKTYRTYRLRGLQILARDKDGKRIEIVFRGGIQIDSTAKYSTSDEFIQNQLESSGSFGKVYYLESVVEDKPVAEEQKPVVETPAAKPALTDVKDIKRFHNLVEMKNAMSELGIPVTPGMNYMAAKAAALKEGYDFQIQK